MAESMLEQLQANVGKEIFVTDWRPVSLQNELDFQKATWVHEDYLGFPLESTDPYGERLLSGFLLQSLLVAFHKKHLPFSMPGGYALNYGSDRVRFLTPVLADEPIRGRCELVEFEDKGDGAFRLLTRNTIEKQGADKPAMVADWITYLVSGA